MALLCLGEHGEHEYYGLDLLQSSGPPGLRWSQHPRPGSAHRSVMFWLGVTWVCVHGLLITEKHLLIKSIYSPLKSGTALFELRKRNSNTFCITFSFSLRLLQLLKCCGIFGAAILKFVSCRGEIFHIL